MSRSGFNRGLAVTAVSALAITGAPFFAGTANAAPLNTQVADADTVVLVSLEDTGQISTKNDGQNSTYRLEAVAGADVAQVRFEYSLNAGVTRTPIATVGRNDNGAFMTEWDAAGLDGAPVIIYAVGINAAGAAIAPANTVPGAAANDSVDSDTGQVDNAAETVNITNGETIGVFQQPYSENVDPDGAGPQAAGVQDNNDVAVAGTASSADPITLGFFNGTTETENGSATPTRPAGTTTGPFSWSGVLDITGYTFGTTDELLVTADNGQTDDTEAFTLYKQTIKSVSATPRDTTVPSGSSTPVTVTVLDQNDKPIAGAQVVSSQTGEERYTDANGQAVFSQNAGTGSNAFYYANATDSDAYEPELGDKASGTVAIAAYNPAPDKLVAESDNGDVFDRTEYDADDITVQVKDQQNRNFNTTGQNVNYYWVFTPFNGGAQVRTPTTGTTPASEDASDRGEYTIPLPNNGSGTYELYASLGANGGGNFPLAESKLLTLKVGEAKFVFDEEEPEQAVAGGEEVVSGRLVLEDGTGLPNRPIELTNAGPGDAKFDQPNGAADNATYTTTTDANGGFTATLDDPTANPQAEETDQVNARTLNFADKDPNPGGDTDNAGANTATDDPQLAGTEDDPQEVQFLKSVTPATVVIDNNGTPEGTAANPETAGEIQDFRVTVRTADDPATTGTDESRPVSNQEVTLTVSNGYFTDGVPQGAVGGDAGVYDNDGQTKTFRTDANGQAVVQVSIGRDAGFDDDGDVTATLTATAGSLSDNESVYWTSENPLNAGDVTITFAPQDDQDSTVLPKARTNQMVELLVKTFDQFGNRVGDEDVDLSDNTNKADINGAFFGGIVTTDYDEESDATATANDSVNQVITGSWTNDTEVLVADGADVGTAPDRADGNDETVTDTITINWYEAGTGGTYTLDDNTGGTAEIGETVSMLVTAIDQEGQPIEGAFVEFIRNGAGANNERQVGTTDENGEATFTFVPTEAGNAKVTATIRETETSGELAVLNDTVVVGGGDVAPYNAFLAGDSNGAKDDQLEVNAPKRAEGAQAKLFKIRPNGRLKIMATQLLDETGDANFKVIDTNGRKFIKYVAKVTRLDGSKFKTNSQRVR
jgi:hypothetical protein